MAANSAAKENLSTPNATNKPILVLILGCMTALTPFSIDMYLPAFQQIASDFSTTVAQVSLSLSSYFVGLASGQLFYGPLLDRFGRKRPVYIGVGFYILASIACVTTESINSLVAFRFIQALGGCVAGVAAMAMVRDLFSVKESAKVYSLLILILGTSPLLAPTIGGWLATQYGWHSVFIVLATGATLLLLAIRFLLRETHQPDPTFSLRAGPLARNYLDILRNPHFYTYVSSAAIAFSGLFIYIVGSPVIFLETFKVSPQVYGWIFAIVAGGMIIASQLNVQLLKKFSNQQLFYAGLCGQVIAGLLLSAGIALDLVQLPGTVFFLFLFLGSFGITNPNASAIALGPFQRVAGSAAALMGFLQMGMGALASTSIGLLKINQLLPIVMFMASTSFVSLLILTWGSRRIKRADPLEPTHG